MRKCDSILIVKQLELSIAAFPYSHIFTFSKRFFLLEPKKRLLLHPHLRVGYTICLSESE
jgi:hypothetical protein